MVQSLDHIEEIKDCPLDEQFFIGITKNKMVVGYRYDCGAIWTECAFVFFSAKCSAIRCPLCCTSAGEMN